MKWEAFYVSELVMICIYRENQNNRERKKKSSNVAGLEGLKLYTVFSPTFANRLYREHNLS